MELLVNDNMIEMNLTPRNNCPVGALIEFSPVSNLIESKEIRYSQISSISSDYKSNYTNTEIEKYSGSAKTHLNNISNGNCFFNDEVETQSLLIAEELEKMQNRSIDEWLTDINNILNQSFENQENFTSIQKFNSLVNSIDVAGENNSNKKISSNNIEDLGVLKEIKSDINIQKKTIILPELLKKSSKSDFILRKSNLRAKLGPMKATVPFTTNQSLDPKSQNQVYFPSLYKKKHMTTPANSNNISERINKENSANKSTPKSKIIHMQRSSTPSIKFNVCRLSKTRSSTPCKGVSRFSGL